MNDEAEGSSTEFAPASERRESRSHVERQAPVGNVRDLRSRPARDEGDSQSGEDGGDGREGDDPPREPMAGEPSSGDDGGGDDDRAAHRKGRNKRRRRGRGEDAEGTGSGVAYERVALDPEEVSKRAWKIYLGEVSEEGLALINDNTAREMAKRSFRLAEIFIEEQSRRG